MPPGSPTRRNPPAPSSPAKQPSPSKSFAPAPSTPAEAKPSFARPSIFKAPAAGAGAAAAAAIPALARAQSAGAGPSAHLEEKFNDVFSLLEEERAKRLDAEEGKRAAVDLAQTLNEHCDSMRAEIERLHMVLRRVDVTTCTTAAEAREMCEMFVRMAAEAETFAVEKEKEEAERKEQEEDEDCISTSPPRTQAGAVVAGEEGTPGTMIPSNEEVRTHETSGARYERTSGACCERIACVAHVRM